MLDVERWPSLSDALLVVALSGWVDAGYAGTGAAALLVDQLDGPRAFARVPLAEHCDLQQTRPTIERAEGTSRLLRWPEIQLVAGRADRDVVVVRGPEPSLRWPTFVAELTDAARRLDVRRAVMLGGMPAAVSHRQPLEVLSTATDEGLASEVGVLRADYHGPTGAQTALQVALGHAGIPAVGCWVQVPQYVAGSPAPPAMYELLVRLRALGRLRLHLDPLGDQRGEWIERIDEGLGERPEVAELVEQIEAERDSFPDQELPSGDELAREIERFLREEP